MAHGHPHQEYGDPDAPGRLRAVVDRLSATLAAGDEEAARATLLAHEVAVSALRRDLNPRTRSQVRGVLLAFDLVRAGELDQARAFVDGELRRSFPGEADADALVPPREG